MRSTFLRKTCILAVSGLMLLTAQISKAECQSSYHQFIMDTEAKQENLATVGAVAGMSSGAGFLAGVTKTIGRTRSSNILLGVAMGVGITVLGGGAYYEYYTQIDEAKWVLQLISESIANKGPVLYEAALKTNLTPAEVSSLVVALNDEDAFCKNGEVALIDGALDLIRPPLAAGD